MIRADSAALKIAFPTPRAPAWARPGRVAEGNDAALEAAFLAGAGLGALDAFLRLAPPWCGVWRRRLALTAAAGSLRLIGRREDEAALRSLMAMGCDAAQGYHLSRPLAADRIPAFITEYQLIRGVSKAPKAQFPSPFTNNRAWRRRKTAPRQSSVSAALA